VEAQQCVEPRATNLPFDLIPLAPTKHNEEIGVLIPVCRCQRAGAKKALAGAKGVRSRARFSVTAQTLDPEEGKGDWIAAGDRSAVAPPVPIPNTEVKRRSADGSGAQGSARVGRCQIQTQPAGNGGLFCFPVRAWVLRWRVEEGRKSYNPIPTAAGRRRDSTFSSRHRRRYRKK
jgi:hypothetical protein